MRELDVVTLRRPVDGHAAGERCTIVDLTGETAIVEFPGETDVVGVAIADLAPLRAASRAA